MNNQIDIVNDWLFSASEGIATPYFRLPVADAENTVYRERVYCYELYYQWRVHWDDRYQFLLNGEVDKRGHSIIQGDRIPNFLVHTPGEMNNLLIVEVKPPNRSIKRIDDDL